MKFVFFSSDNNSSSGAFKAELQIIKDLLKNGNQVTLVLPYHGSGEKIIEKNENLTIKHIFSVFWLSFKPKTIFDFLFHFFAFPINLIAKIRTKSFLKKNGFDLAVVNTVWNGVGGEVAIKQNLPTVWHFREIPEFGQHRDFMFKKHSYEIMAKANYCICCSDFVREYFSKKISNPNVITIHDGVDKSIYYNERSIFNESTTHFLIVGRVFKQKGQHLALKALNELQDYDFDLTIVGHCSKSYKRKLLKLCPNIKDRVFFKGVTNKPVEYYKKADIFLMTSIGEAFGLVTVEAMMSGCCVISSKCDGGLEIVKDTNNGLFFTPNDYLSLKETIKYALDNKEQMKSIAKVGQQRGLNFFSKERNFNSIIEYYKKAANKK